jgi:hypothetical protein
MTHREHLADRRFHRSVELEHDGLRYTAGLGFYDDGRAAEVFLTCGKVGSLAETNARDGAILVSLLLQLGVPLKTLQHMVTRDARGEPLGPLGAVLDLLAAERQALAR